MSEQGNHWESIYGATPWTEVSWYERDLATSLRLIREVAASSAAVVDIGTGASFFIDGLLAAMVGDGTGDVLNRVVKYTSIGPVVQVSEIVV